MTPFRLSSNKLRVLRQTRPDMTDNRRLKGREGEGPAGMKPVHKGLPRHRILPGEGAALRLGSDPAPGLSGVSCQVPPLTASRPHASEPSPLLVAQSS